MSLGRKKVIIRRFTRDWIAGYLQPVGFAANDRIELLDLAGKVAVIPLSEVKWTCFVRDFNSGEMENPERLLRKTFAGRPRSEGLWLRLKLTDGDWIEGLAANDLSLIDPSGLFLTPPDIRSNTQRMFIPRPSIAELEIVAVIANPSRKKQAEAVRQEPLQDELFGAPE
jgi:hypothetical protein